MSELLTHKDKYGSYELAIVGSVLQAKLNGLIGLSLATKCSIDTTALTEKLAANPWGFMGDYSRCEGYTPEAVAVLSRQYKFGYEQGCIIDSYCTESAMLIDQLGKIRLANGINKDVKKVIFNSQSKCLNLINHCLTKELHRLK